MSLDKIYNPEIIFEKLARGESLTTISNFYDCSEDELIEAIKKHFDWKDDIDVLYVARGRNKRQGKQIHNNAILKRIKEWRMMHPKMTKEEFKERLKQSGRSYTEETLAIVDDQWDNFDPNKDENLREI